MFESNDPNALLHFQAKYIAAFDRRRSRGGQRAVSALDGWAVLLPARIVNEELGDYIEDINRRVAKGQRFKAYLRVFAAMFWTSVNAVGYFLKEIGKKKAA